MNQKRDASKLFADRGFVPPETYDAVMSVLARLELALEEETALVRTQVSGNLSELTRQKRTGLLELNRLMRTIENTIPSQGMIARLAEFRKKLAANSEALRIKLKATQEVNAIIVRALHEAESDGTYSRAHGRGIYGYE